MPGLAVGGLAPLTTVDFPGRLAAVVFLQGCPWDCSYCHNPHLIPARAAAGRDWGEVTAFLKKRRGLLDAVVFSGGEPAFQPELADGLREARALGFQVGLHTNGAFPARLREVLPLVDWVGIDVKTRFDDYERVSRRPGSGEKARQSVRFVLESGVDYEVRTTVHPSFHSAALLTDLARDLHALGVRHWRLQEFRADGCREAALAGVRGAGVPAELEASLASLFQTFEVRRA